MASSVSGGAKTILRIEGLCVLIVSLFAYSKFGAGWGAFALFFFAPDLSLLGYLGGPRLGACLYNIAHTYAGPLLLLAGGTGAPNTLATTIGIIWTAHIGFDRALGYGLKYSSGFKFTHLGVIGRSP